MRAAMERLQPEDRAIALQEDDALLQAESELPEDLDRTASESESDSSSEEELPVFDEGGMSEQRVPSPMPSPPPTVSEAQGTQPSELSSLLQQLI